MKGKIGTHSYIKLCMHVSSDIDLTEESNFNYWNWWQQTHTQKPNGSERERKHMYGGRYVKEKWILYVKAGGKDWISTLNQLEQKQQHIDYRLHWNVATTTKERSFHTHDNRIEGFHEETFFYLILMIFISTVFYFFNCFEKRS